MSKRGKQTDYAAELEKSYACWDHLKEYGGSDPFWPDGVSMNLVRNHIIYVKAENNQLKAYYVVNDDISGSVDLRVD